MIIKNKNAKNFDMFLVINTLILIVYGIVVISSATKTRALLHGYWRNQIIWAITGLVLMIIVVYMDYNIIGEFTKYLYIFNLIALLAVKFTSAGTSKLGAQRWIKLGPIVLQPSEFAKIIIIITLAKFIEKKAAKINEVSEIGKVLLYVGVPMILIMKQPDLGTSLVFIAITVAMLYTAGLNYKYFVGAIMAGLAAIPVMWFFILKPFQKNRLRVFFNPSLDTAGIGYHVTQSKIAIGSGRIIGKGIYHGGFTQSNYLPESHTDFIFGVVGEELGFIGTSILIILLSVLIWRCLVIAMQSRDLYGKLICIGVAAMLGFQLLINAGMTTGIMPVTGIPLPFISYGGSSLWVNMMSIGLVLNVGMRQQRINFS